MSSVCKRPKASIAKYASSDEGKLNQSIKVTHQHSTGDSFQDNFNPQIFEKLSKVCNISFAGNSFINCQNGAEVTKAKGLLKAQGTFFVTKKDKSIVTLPSRLKLQPGRQLLTPDNFSDASTALGISIRGSVRRLVRPSVRLAMMNYLICPRARVFEKHFKCVLASRYEGLPVRRSGCLSGGRSVRRSVTRFSE